VIGSRARALAALRKSVSIEPPSDIAYAAGLPSAIEARVLLDVMTRELVLATSAPDR
jgi:hypothetical protein